MPFPHLLFIRAIRVVGSTGLVGRSVWNTHNKSQHVEQWMTSFTWGRNVSLSQKRWLTSVRQLLQSISESTRTTKTWGWGWLWGFINVRFIGTKSDWSSDSFRVVQLKKSCEDDSSVNLEKSVMIKNKQSNSFTFHHQILSKNFLIE